MWCEQGFRDLAQFFKMLPDCSVNLSARFMNLGLEFAVDVEEMKFPEETYGIFSGVDFAFPPYIPGELRNAFPMAYLNPENRARALEIVASESTLDIEKIYVALQILIKDLSEAARDTPHVLYNAILTALVIPLRALKNGTYKAKRDAQTAAQATAPRSTASNADTDMTSQGSDTG